MVFLKSIFIKIWYIKVYIYRLSGVYKKLTSPGDGLMLEKSGSVGWECCKEINFFKHEENPNLIFYKADLLESFK